MGVNKLVRAEFNISGHVQGVGFRYFVYSNANSLGLKGYAQNLYNGDVKTVAEGDSSLIEELNRILKEGPSRSYVDKVTVIYSEYKGEFSDFGIK